MMKVETRKTAAGTEYWDAKEKKTLFVPVGTEPDFEVTVNPKSMIVGVDLAKDEDNTSFGVSDGDKNYQLSDMTIKELKALAEEYKIEVPKDITKRDDIAKHIFENWSEDNQ